MAALQAGKALLCCDRCEVSENFCCRERRRDCARPRRLDCPSPVAHSCRRLSARWSSNGPTRRAGANDAARTTHGRRLAHRRGSAVVAQAGRDGSASDARGSSSGQWRGRVAGPNHARACRDTMDGRRGRQLVLVLCPFPPLLLLCLVPCRWCGLVWWCVCTSYLALGPFLSGLRADGQTNSRHASQPDDAASDEAAGQADKQKNRQTGRLRRRTTRAAQHSLAATPARDRARRGAACQWSTCKHGRQA